LTNQEQTALATFEDFVKEALEIIEAANKNSIPLRMIGALGIYRHCPNSKHMYAQMKRVPTDIDLIGYSKYSRKTIDFMKSQGYVPSSERLMALYGMQRQMYQSERSGRQIDIFFDKLEMCHTIDIKDRLEVDYPTISPADFLLEKMQIVEINEKDVKDTIILIKEHEIENSDDNVINMEYVAKLLSEDWGFYYTVKTNLNKLREFLPNYSTLIEDDRKTVNERVSRIIERMEKEPKSLRWKIREKQGTKKKWYRDVEVERAELKTGGVG